ncbi:hypothetical protein KKA14_21485 [bacterium]|nr:hypothetical protein [bacterium]
MKRLILAISAVLIISCSAFAQNACPSRESMKPQPRNPRSADATAVCLDSFEMCNNWARHYCYSGSHENTVNEMLRGMKERGVTITTAIIKSVAQRTLKNR